MTHQTWQTLYQFCPKCQSQLKHQSRSARCPNCNFHYYHNPAPAVVVLIAKGAKPPLNQQVLLAKRAIEPFKGAWDLPGGFIEPKETTAETVLREIQEETGLKVKIKKMLGSIPDIYGDENIPTLNLVYLVEIESGQIKAQDDVAELKWFTLDKLPKNLAFKNTSIALDIYQKIIK